MDSFWKQQLEQGFRTIDELVDDGSDVNFGPRLRLLTDDPDDEAAVTFLLKEYDSEAEDFIRWLLSRACTRARLVSATDSSRTMAFFCGVNLPVRVPGFQGDALLGTLLCVATCLRGTGLVRKMLAASVALSARHGYLVRVSTTPASLALQPCATISRYTFGPGEADRKSGDSLTGRITYSPRQVVQYLSRKQIMYGIDWTRFNACRHPSLQGIMRKGVGAALLVQVNSVSHQVIGFYVEDQHKIWAFLCWIVFHLGTTLILDAWDPEIRRLATRFRAATIVPKYHIFFHNADVRHLGTDCAVPLL